jgi:Ca-activated chloride channel family protein
LADAQQQRFQEFAFRNHDGQPGSLITPDNGLLPQEPKQVLSPPSPQVLDAILRSWEDVRKRARVILLIDVSGSMEQGAGSGGSKLELAKKAAVDALSLFAPDDEVGLWIFSTDLGPEHADYQEVVPIGRVGANLATLKTSIRDLRTYNGTPLYAAIGAAVDEIRSGLDTDRINGVVVLTDGKNEVSEGGDVCLDCLKENLDSEFAVRVFTIAYGADANLDVLQQIAQASRAASYDASDPTSISKVFVSVISNF